MSRVVATSPAQETKWTVISGPMKGSVRLMTLTTFTIGRSPENQLIIVNDPKCSRKHATVHWTNRGCEINSMSPENPLLVNRREVAKKILKDGDIIVLGDTELQFNLTTDTSPSISRQKTQIVLLGQQPQSGNSKVSAVTNAGVSALSATSPAPITAPAPLYSPSRSMPKTRSSSRRKNNNPVRLILYFVIGIIVLFLFTETVTNKKAKVDLRTEQQIQADIETANKLKEAALNTPLKRMEESVTSRQAQENYVRGFRDYRKGQFEPARDSFQACLALDPTHSLCNRYLRLAQRRFNEMIQYNMVLGRKYRDQNQFKACRSSFRNVMAMVKDANSLAYKEAKANYDACNSLVEGRY